MLANASHNKLWSRNSKLNSLRPQSLQFLLQLLALLIMLLHESREIACCGEKPSRIRNTFGRIEFIKLVVGSERKSILLRFERVVLLLELFWENAGVFECDNGW
jgi:hypothetical protein